MIIIQDSDKEIFYVQLLQGTSDYYVMLTVFDDSDGEYSTSPYVISDTATSIAVEYIISDGSDNGSAKLIVDGETKETLSSLDNDTKTGNFSAYFGNCNIASQSGILYIDNCGVNGEVFLEDDSLAVAYVTANGDYAIVIYPSVVSFTSAPLSSVILENPTVDIHFDGNPTSSILTEH